MVFKTFFVSFFILTLENTNGYNILAIFPTPSISHQQSGLSVTRSLAQKGHNVTVITTNPGLYDPIPNHYEIDVSILYSIWEKFQKESNFSLQTTISIKDALLKFPGIFALFSEQVNLTPGVQELIRSTDTKFDLILYEGHYPSCLGFVHHFNYPPSVAYITVPRLIPLEYSMGNPINPSYISSYVTEFSDKMTFFERLQNTFYVLLEIYAQNYYAYPIHDKIAKKYFGENVPPTKDLVKNNSLLLISGDLSQSYPAPFQPNTVHIGTVHITNHTSLPYDIQEWMDEAEEGVIYFSLGSNMKGISLLKHQRQSFAKAFKQFSKFRIIWKWESEKGFPERPENVLLKQWLPQQAILAHRKIRLFITHGGQQSHQEAIHYGVPMLVVPVFWDQFWNAKKVEETGAGLIVPIYDVTYHGIYESMKVLLSDSSFKSNVDKLSKLSKDKLMSNTETAVWWIEYVIRHKGASHLRPAVQELNWFQYFLLDVAVFIMCILFVVSFLIYYFMKACLHVLSIQLKMKKIS